MKLRYYCNSRGDCEMYEYINRINNEKHKLVIIDALDKLESKDLYQLLLTKFVKKIKGDLYELKADYGKFKYRVLFGKRLNYYYVVLIFLKKTQKIEKRHINLAEKRLKQIK